VGAARRGAGRRPPARGAAGRFASWPTILTGPAGDNPGMDISAKLQIKPGQTLAAVALPPGVAPLADPAATPPADPGDADAVVAFVRQAEELDTVAGPAIAAARA